MKDQSTANNIRAEAAIVMGSVINGTDENARAAIETGIVIALLKCVYKLLLFIFVSC